MSENANVVALAMELFQREYRGSKPSDNPQLFQCYIDHIKKLMTMPVPEPMKGKQMPGDLDKAKEYEEILAGRLPTLAGFEAKLKEAAKAGTVPVVPEPVAQVAVLDPDAEPVGGVAESTGAKAEVLKAGIVQPGTFDPPKGHVPAPGLATGGKPDLSIDEKG